MRKNDIANRIEEYRESKRLTKSEFARSVNSDPGNIGAILRGQRSVTVEVVLSFLASYSEVSAEWLLRGTGSMLLTSPSASLSIGGDNHGLASVSSGDGNTTNNTSTTNNSTTNNYGTDCKEKANAQAMQIEIAVLKEKINALNLVIEEKERIIRIYEQLNKYITV